MAKKANKGVIIGIFLIIIAAVLAVVFVFLFKGKSTKSMAADLNNIVTTGYLAKDAKVPEGSKENTYNTIYDYLNDYGRMYPLNTEVSNYKNALEGYANIAIYFNNEAPFMEHTKSYSKNRKKITASLKSANNNALKLCETIREKSEVIGGNTGWQQVVWDNYKDYAKNMILDTIKAFDLLSKVYADSVSSKLLNNDLTDALFVGLSYHADALKNNVSGENMGGNLNKFAKAYFNESTEKCVLNYVYKEKAFKDEIKSIVEKGEESMIFEDFLAGTYKIG